ncbi:hypothetical protein [Mammaliicoccus sciuri]|nr:hypothetical protein [Mammaliicoccus sciuri]
MKFIYIKISVNVLNIKMYYSLNLENLDDVIEEFNSKFNLKYER